MKNRIFTVILLSALALAGCEGTPSSSGDASSASSSDRATETADLSAFPENVRPRAAALMDAARSAPDDPQSAGLAGMFAHAYGSTALAVTYYRRATELAPDQFAWPYLLGAALMDEGRDEEAVAALRDAQAIEANYPPLQLRLAQLAINRADQDEAKRLLVDLTANAPQFAQARYQHGKLALDQGDINTAIEQLQAAVELTPHYGAAHYSLAGAYEAAGDTDLAQKHRLLFEKHQRGAPAEVDRFVTQVQDLRRSPKQAIVRAGRLSAQGRFDEAAAIFVELLEVQPDNMVAHTNLVGLYGQLGQIDKARAQYLAGVEVSSDVPALHKNFGILMLREDQFEQARDAFDKTIALDADEGEAYRYRGIAQQRLGDLDAAMASFETAFEKDPLDYQAGYLLGIALMSKGDNTRAATVLARTVEPVSRKTPAYLRALANAHYNAGEYDQAAEALNQAREIALGYGQSSVVSDIDAELAQLAEAGGETS